LERAGYCPLLDALHYQNHPSRQHRAYAGQQPPVNRDFSRLFKLICPPRPPLRHPADRQVPQLPCPIADAQLVEVRIARHPSASDNRREHPNRTDRPELPADFAVDRNLLLP
jgi:hypothetical protein